MPTENLKTPPKKTIFARGIFNRTKVMSYNPLAEQANAELSANGCNVLSMLSERGKAIFFPRKGILGQGAEAKGSEINATIGTALEDDGSPLVLDCVLKSLNLPKQAFLYAPSFGNPDLRKAWKEQIVRKNPSLAGKQFSNPVVTCALTHAISCAGYLFLDPGDEVIIPDLYWDNYELVFVNSCGAKIKTFNTFKDGGFDTEALKAALAESKSQKKVVLLNFPNNPTGYTATEKEAVEIAKILTDCAAAGNKVVALLDDAYFGLVYEEGVTKESLFVKLLEANENLLAVKLDGPTKEDYVWGFRVGFMTFGFKGAIRSVATSLTPRASARRFCSPPSRAKNTCSRSRKSTKRSRSASTSSRTNSLRTRNTRKPSSPCRATAATSCASSRRAWTPKNCARSSSRTTARARRSDR